MQYTRPTALFTIAAFLLGFGLGGASMHYASAEGLFGVTASVKQIGSALVDMQKNVDELQKNMGTIKHAKEQLAALAPESGGDAIKKTELPLRHTDFQSSGVMVVEGSSHAYEFPHSWTAQGYEFNNVFCLFRMYLP